MATAVRSMAALAGAWLASAVCGAPPAHPHLFFTKDDLPAIRKRIEAGLAKRVWEATKARCDRAVADPAPIRKRLAELAKPTAGKRSKTRMAELVVSLAFAWHVTGAPAYRGTLESLLATIDRQFPTPADAPVHWPYTYDLAYDLMSAAQRDRVRAHLVAECRGVFEKLPHQPLALSDASLGLRCSNIHCAFGASMARPAAAIVGEPGYRREWLDAAARIMREFLDEAVGPDGMFQEHPSYWRYGMDALGGAEAIWLLRGKGVDLTSHAGLLRSPEWLCHATTPLGVTDARGDCTHSIPHSGATVLVHHLRPTDPAANRILELAGRTIDGVAGPILTILWDTPLGETRLAGHLPRVRHYPDFNMVYFHSDWSSDAIYSSFQARWEWGHCHNDIGQLTLWAHRHIWAIDSGYGVGQAEAHNLVLIDGQGMGGSDGTRRCAGGKLRQVLDSPLATLAEADQREAYSYMIGGHFDWVTRWPGRPVARANRFWHVVHGTHGAPTYFVIVDRIQKDLDEHDYTWLLGTPMDNELRLGKARATIHNPHNAAFIRGHDDPDLTLNDTKRFHIETDVTVRQQGEYEVWVFIRNERYPGCYINGWIDGKGIGYLAFGGPTWRWAKLSRHKTKLGPGKHTLRINQNPSANAIWIKRVLLTRKADFKPAGTAVVNDEQTMTVVFDRRNTRVLKPWAWAGLPYPLATLEIALAGPDKVALAQDVYEAKGHWHVERHRRLRATSRAVRGDFVVVLYPRREGMPPLALEKSDAKGFERRLRWPAATDHLAPDAPTVDHLDRDGRFVKPAHGSDGEFALVRETPPAAVAGYLLVNGTTLGFRGRPLVETSRVGPYGQVSVACDGKTLAVHAHVRQNAKWQVERDGTLRAYGPRVTAATVNGRSAALKRDGDCVIVPVRTRRFVSTTDRITQRIQRRYDSGQALGER